MQRKNNLKAKSQLKAKTQLKPSQIKKKVKLKTIPTLIKQADKIYSQYVRLRDSEICPDGRRGSCITCSKSIVVIDEDNKWKRNAQNGHFIGRGCHYLRYNEQNTNLQCAYCNAWRDKESMLSAYREAVDAKYGGGTYLKLKNLAHKHNTYRLKRQELEEIIYKYKEIVDNLLLTNK